MPRARCPQTHIDLRLTGLELSHFKPKTAKDAPIDGTLVGRVKLEGAGGSVAKFVSSSNGSATFVLPRGEVREALAELTGINVSRGLGLLLRRDDDKTPIRCGVADFTAKNGVLEAKNLVFDTKDVVITGKGSVDLGHGVLRSHHPGAAQEFPAVRLKSPVAIKGPLRKPDFGLDSGYSIGADRHRRGTLGGRCAARRRARVRRPGPGERCRLLRAAGRSEGRRRAGENGRREARGSRLSRASAMIAG